MASRFAECHLLLKKVFYCFGSADFSCAGATDALASFVLFEKKLALLPCLQHDFPFPSQCTFFSATEDDFAVAALPSLAWLPLSVVLSLLVLEEEAWLQDGVPLWQSREGDSFTSDLEVVTE